MMIRQQQSPNSRQEEADGEGEPKKEEDDDDADEGKNGDWGGDNDHPDEREVDDGSTPPLDKVGATLPIPQSPLFGSKLAPAALASTQLSVIPGRIPTTTAQQQRPDSAASSSLVARSDSSAKDGSRPGDQKEIFIEVGSTCRAGDDVRFSRRSRQLQQPQQHQHQHQLVSSPVRTAATDSVDAYSQNEYSPSLGLRFANYPRHRSSAASMSALEQVRSRQHAYAQLAVQQVRHIERYRRSGGGGGDRVPLLTKDAQQPRTAEQFYQWLTSATTTATTKNSSAASAPPGGRPNRHPKRTSEREYPLGLRNESSHRRMRHERRDITVLPTDHDENGDDFDENDSVESGDGGSYQDDPSAYAGDEDAYVNNISSDEGADVDDEGTAVAVAMMMMKRNRTSFGRSRSQKSTNTSGSAAKEGSSTIRAWREAAKVVADCHERMLCVQENAKLKQQQLRLQNEHLQYLLESSKVTIEQLQLKLIFSSSHVKPSSSKSPREASADDHDDDDDTCEATKLPPRPSMDDVRGHVEALVEHQQELLKENAALKQSLLQCGCVRCIEQYRAHQRSFSAASGGAGAAHRSAVTGQHRAGATDAARGDGLPSAATLNDIPIPSMVPTENSSSSSSSSTSTSASRHPPRSAKSASSEQDAAKEPVHHDVHKGEGRTVPDKPLGNVDEDAPSCGADDDQLSQSHAESNQSRPLDGAENEDPMTHCHDIEMELREASETVVKTKRLRSGTQTRRRSRASSGGLSLGEYLTTQQDDGNTTAGSLAEQEYDRRYSRGESVSVLSSMSRITFKTIDEDITVDCSMMNDEATSGVDDSAAQLDASGDMSLLPIELTERERETHHSSMGSSSGVRPPRRMLVESASSITTSLSNGDNSLRLSSRSCEATVRNSNLRETPGKSAGFDPVNVRPGAPSRRGRKPSRMHLSAPSADQLDVSLDQVYSLADPSTIMAPPVLAPCVKPQAPHERTDSPDRPREYPLMDVESDPVPPAVEGWQQKYVTNDDLYSSAVMNAMEKRKKVGAAVLPRNARDSDSERFVAELSKCLQGGSTHSTLGEASASAPEQALPSAVKVTAVPSAMRSPQQPLSYDDALMAAMRKESSHPLTVGPPTGGMPVPSSSHRKSQWKAPAVFKSWK